eukprot:jgi/Mesvir1/29182/Mv19458-RA.1
MGSFEGLRVLLDLLQHAAQHGMADVVAAVRALMEGKLLTFGALPMAPPPLVDAEINGVDPGGGAQAAAKGRITPADIAKRQELRRALKKADKHLEDSALEEHKRLRETGKAVAQYADARRHLFVYALKTDEPASLLPSIKDPSLEEVGLAAPAALQEAWDALRDFREPYWAERSRQAAEAAWEVVGAGPSNSQGRQQGNRPHRPGAMVGITARLLAGSSACDEACDEEGEVGWGGPPTRRTAEGSISTFCECCPFFATKGISAVHALGLSLPAD